MSLLDLPPELLQSITEYLNLQDLFVFRACSRYFRELAERQIPKVPTLCTKEHQGFNPEIFKTVLEMCKELRVIRLIDLDWLTDEMLIKLLNNNKQILVIHLGSLPSITTRALHPLIDCKHITVLLLHLVPCDDDFLQKFSRTHNQMAQITHCHFNTVSPTSQVYADFIAQQPHLLILQIDGTEFEVILEAICRVCKDLRFLTLYQYAGGYEDKLRAVADNCPQLEFLVLQTNANISVGTYSYFAQKKVCITDNPCEIQEGLKRIFENVRIIIH